MTLSLASIMTASPIIGSISMAQNNYKDIESTNIGEDSNVLARYDGKTMTVEIFGYGTLSKEKFENFLNEVIAKNNYQKTTQGQSINIKSKVSLPKDSEGFFAGFTDDSKDGRMFLNNARIYGAENLNTSKVESMKYMFFKASEMNPDVTNWDVSNVKDFRYMFTATGMARPNLEKWQISRDADASHMLYNAYDATSIKLPDLSNVPEENLTNFYSPAYPPTITGNKVSLAKVLKTVGFNQFFTEKGEYTDDGVVGYNLYRGDNLLKPVTKDGYKLKGFIDKDKDFSNLNNLLDELEDDIYTLAPYLKLDESDVKTITLEKGDKVPDSIYMDSLYINTIPNHLRKYVLKGYTLSAINPIDTSFEHKGMVSVILDTHSPLKTVEGYKDSLDNFPNAIEGYNGPYSAKVLVEIPYEVVPKNENVSPSPHRGGGFVDNTVRSERISGKSRVETAIEASKKVYNNANTVIIANSHNYPDVITAVPLASKYKAPILLNEKGSLNSKNLDEIKRLKAYKVIIVGGSDSISNRVETSLKDSGVNVERIAGKNRYSTSIEVAKELGNKQKVILASGEVFADALSASQIKDRPILLTNRKDNDEVLKYLEKNAIFDAYIAGGKAKDDINLTLPREVQSTVYSGKDRYETAIKLSRLVAGDHITLASGEKFADALIAGAYSQARNDKLLLTNNKYNNDLVSEIRESKNKLITVIGGTNTIFNTTIENILYNLNQN